MPPHLCASLHGEPTQDKCFTQIWGIFRFHEVSQSRLHLVKSMNHLIAGNNRRLRQHMPRYLTPITHDKLMQATTSWPRLAEAHVLAHLQACAMLIQPVSQTLEILNDWLLYRPPLVPFHGLSSATATRQTLRCNTYVPPANTSANTSS